ncbi:MAG: HD domain-containing protein [Faecalicoccus sp.]|uniref:CCA tRNA nucleotidyltransferase n=1 Tax=Faecalicoccus sp. TaxID=1971758 RepID=UPI002F924A0E
MVLPENILEILKTLNQAGYEAYVVGGCVRDSLLKRDCADYDVCTSALPNVVQSLFTHAIPTGIKHGTITVLTPQPVEITTFRSETTYKDHRHPDRVEFVSSIIEDLRRRDFTINAMAYHPNTGLIDPFGGKKDLSLKIVRCVGDANQRFQEDALRMIRAHRFCAKLGFTMDKTTQEALHQNSKLIQWVAVERIDKELKEILQYNPYEIENMTQLLSKWMPELELCKSCAQNSPWHDTNVLHHSLRAITFLTPFDETLALALLFHDLGKPATKTTKDGIDHFYGHPLESAKIADRICKALKLSTYQRKLICSLVKHHDEKLPLRLRTIYHFRIQMGFDDAWMQKLFTISICDLKAHSLKGQQSVQSVLDFIDFYEKNKDRPMSFHDLEINGKDVLTHTSFTGKDVRKVLQRCLDLVFYDPEQNTREHLIEMIQRWRVI